MCPVYYNYSNAGCEGLAKFGRPYSNLVMQTLSPPPPPRLMDEGYAW